MTTALGRVTRPGATVVVDLDLRRAAASELATRAKAGSDVAFQELARRLSSKMRAIERDFYIPAPTPTMSTRRPSAASTRRLATTDQGLATSRSSPATASAARSSRIFRRP